MGRAGSTGQGGPQTPVSSCPPSFNTAPGGLVLRAPCRLPTAPGCFSADVLLPVPAARASPAVRTTSCHLQIWPLGCSEANEPHAPRETRPAPHATRVSGARAALPPQAQGCGPGGGAGPRCSRAQPPQQGAPDLGLSPTSLLPVMVRLLTRQCLGNRAPLSRRDRCPWSRPCGASATRPRAR